MREAEAGCGASDLRETRKGEKVAASPSCPTRRPPGHGVTSPVNCFSPGQLSLDCQEGDSGLDAGTEHFPSLSEVSACRGQPRLKPWLASPFQAPKGPAVASCAAASDLPRLHLGHASSSQGF